MESLAATLSEHLRLDQASILATLVETAGSTPRDVGTGMVISEHTFAGTIGGGRLEWIAIERAREMIAEGLSKSRLEVPLGPAVGQCCGGKVEIEFVRADRETLKAVEEVEARRQSRRPRVMIFGAGHVGAELAKALARLPFETSLVDDRQELLRDLPPEIRPLATADPASEARSAPLSTAMVVLTYSHSLDFEVTEAALRRGDAPYVGLIGSKTKRTKFTRWFLSRGGTRAQLRRLVCPIGGDRVKDKRPEVIAALAAAELVTSVLAAESSDSAEDQGGPVIEAMGGG